MRTNTTPRLMTYNSLLMADIIMPVQWGPSAREQQIALSPACRLMHALLENALRDYQSNAMMGGHRRAHRIHAEAAEWLFADDPTWLFSSTNVMHALGIDPERTRKGLKQWLAARQPEQPAVVEIVEAVPTPVAGRPPTRTARYTIARRRLSGSPYYNAYVTDHETRTVYLIGTYAPGKNLMRLEDRIKANPNKYGPRYLAGLTGRPSRMSEAKTPPPQQKAEAAMRKEEINDAHASDTTGR